MPTPSSTTTPPLLVACLCAQWCGTCNEYRPLFNQLQAEFPQATFRWVDIEDEADLVDPVDVENFPTLLIAIGAQARFFGTLTPHIDTLRRLIQTHLAQDSPRSIGVEADALAQRIQSQIDL